MIVYVVAFEPDCTERNGTGGFFWYPIEAQAIYFLCAELARERGLGGYNYIIRPIEVPDTLTGDPCAITDYIDARSELWSLPLGSLESECA